MSRRGAVTLGDLAGRIEVLRVECSVCSRAGQYRVLRLIKELGEDFTLPALRAKLTADCPRRTSVAISQQCQAAFPDLKRVV